jgi:hypothetical protein
LRRPGLSHLGAELLTQFLTPSIGWRRDAIGRHVATNTLSGRRFEVGEPRNAPLRVVPGAKLRRIRRPVMANRHCVRGLRYPVEPSRLAGVGHDR